MAVDDISEQVRIDTAGFDKLKQPRLVLCAPCLECDGGEVLCGENPDGRALHVHFHGISKGLFRQGAGRREEPHGPAADDDIFALDGAAAPFEISEDRLQTQEQASGIGLHGDEDSDIEGGKGLQIKCRGYRPANGAATHDAIGLHLVQGLDDFADIHQMSSGYEDGVKFFNERLGLFVEDAFGDSDIFDEVDTSLRAVRLDGCHTQEGSELLLFAAGAGSLLCCCFFLCGFLLRRGGF